MGAKLTYSLFQGCFGIMWFLAVAAVTLLVLGQALAAFLVLIFAVCFGGLCGWMVWIAIENKFEWKSQADKDSEQRNYNYKPAATPTVKTVTKR